MILNGYGLAGWKWNNLVNKVYKTEISSMNDLKPSRGRKVISQSMTQYIFMVRAAKSQSSCFFDEKVKPLDVSVK